MKKSNIIVLAIAGLASLALLWLWWYLGFARVDGPVDVLITAAWWLAIGLVAYGIYRFEHGRRKQMRTIYVSPTALYNCEAGLVECTPAQRVDKVEEILKNMQYGFDFQDMPGRSAFDCTFIIHTDDYSAGGGWKGRIVKVDRSGAGATSEKSFSSRTSLAQAIV